MPQRSQILKDLRAARRAGGQMTPRLTVHLAGMVQAWRQDPTASELTFDEWCASLADLEAPREKILVTSVHMAFVNPDAKYVPS